VEQIEIRLFKKFSLCQSKADLDLSQSQKALELLGYLLLFRDQPHHRENLSEKLWGNLKIENRKAYLRKALWQLHAFLETTFGSNAVLQVIVDSEWLQMNLADSWLDVVEFEAAYSRVVSMRGSNLSPEDYTQLRTVVYDVYRGDLLEGWYQEWCIFERERYKEMLYQIINKLMAFCESNDDFKDGIEHGIALLRREPAHERTHRRLMRLYYLSGDRYAALRQFQECSRVLKKGFGVEPGIRTQQLRHYIENEEHTLVTSKFPDVALGEKSGSMAEVIAALGHITQKIKDQTNRQSVLLQQVETLVTELHHTETDK
jgi:DNA-binding SARP family transcriptional activator